MIVLKGLADQRALPELGLRRRLRPGFQRPGGATGAAEPAGPDSEDLRRPDEGAGGSKRPENGRFRVRK